MKISQQENHDGTINITTTCEHCGLPITKNGKYGIFGPVTIKAINNRKASGATQTPKLDPKTGLPDNSLGLPKFDTSVDRFNKFGISKPEPIKEHFQHT
jgi:hypothetical protein